MLGKHAKLMSDRPAPEGKDIKAFVDRFVERTNEYEDIVVEAHLIEYFTHWRQHLGGQMQMWELEIATAQVHDAMPASDYAQPLFVQTLDNCFLPIRPTTEWPPADGTEYFEAGWFGHRITYRINPHNVEVKLVAPKQYVASFEDRIMAAIRQHEIKVDAKLEEFKAELREQRRSGRGRRLQGGNR